MNGQDALKELQNRHPELELRGLEDAKDWLNGLTNQQAEDLELEDLHLLRSIMDQLLFYAEMSDSYQVTQMEKNQIPIRFVKNLIEKKEAL